MTAPAAPERAPFAYPVADLIVRWCRHSRFKPAGRDEWTTAVSKLSKFGTAMDQTVPKRIDAFVESFAPTNNERFWPGVGYTERIAFILHSGVVASDGVRRFNISHLSSHEMEFVTARVPFHLDTVKRTLLDVAAAKDIEVLKKRIKYLEEHPEDPAVFNDSNIQERVLSKSEIVFLQELQRKLKERVSTTPPAMRK